MSGGELWRVGHRGDPLAFTPFELCAWNHRFDDARQRFRTVYCAKRPETSLREVLADLRPNLKAQRAFAEAFGAAAIEDLPAAPVTARWREEHLLVPAEMVLDGELIDLTDPAVRADLFERCNAGALRFPFRLDGRPALVAFEGRSELVAAGDPVALTDPAPEALLAICREWGLALEPTGGR